MNCDVEEKRHMRKKRIICVAVMILVALGVFTACFLYYDSKYIRFQDEIVKTQVLRALDSQKDRVLKTEAEEIGFLETFQIPEASTFEDLMALPKLKFVAVFGVPVEEESEEYERYENMIKDTFPKLKNLRKVFFYDKRATYNLDAFSDCRQIEELWIQENYVKNIRGVEGMKNLRILVLRENSFTDISPLEKLEKLEVVDFTGVSLENIESLLKIPSLKLVYYTAKNKEQEEILRLLSEKGVEVIQNNEERYVNIFDEMEQLGIEYVDYRKL